MTSYALCVSTRIFYSNEIYFLYFYLIFVIFVGPTINADKEILHTSKNPILEQIRQDRRSSSPGSGVGSPGSVRSRLSNGSSRNDSVDSSGIGNEDNTEDIAVEIKSLKQQLGDLRRKRYVLCCTVLQYEN